MIYITKDIMIYVVLEIILYICCGIATFFSRHLVSQPSSGHWPVLYKVVLLHQVGTFCIWYLVFFECLDPTVISMLDRFITPTRCVG